MMENRFDLDLDFNNEVSEVLRKERPRHADTYQQAVTYASKRKLGKDVVHNAMREAMSSVSGDELNKEAVQACESVYEEALKKYRTANNPFPDEAAQAMNACREKYIKDKTSGGGKGSFWNNVFNSINKVSDTIQSMNQNKQQQNAGAGQPQQQYYAPPAPDTKTDVRILGMKPLVFVLVALGVTAGTVIAINQIGKNKGGKK